MPRLQQAAGAVLAPAAALLFSLAGASGVAAQSRPDSGAFIVRLGVDTVAVERYVLSGNTLRATGLTRSPRTAVRQYVIQFDDGGGIQSFATAAQGQSVEPRPLAVPGTIPLAGQLYTPFQLAVQRAHHAGGNSVNVTLLNGTDAVPVVIRKTSPTTFAMPNQFGVPLTITTDQAGRIVSVDASGGTTVQRLTWVDIDALEREFRRRDDAGTGLGPLSPLDTVAAAVKGASIEIEYSRPSLRGRPLALLVPDGQVWRTGANNATHLRTDRVLRFGSVTVPAGTYTIFTLPSASGWKLIINRQTGQAGTDYDQAQDLARIDMMVLRDARATERFTIDVAETNEGGVLRLRWGTTEASLPFRIES